MNHPDRSTWVMIAAAVAFALAVQAALILQCAWGIS